MGILDAALNFGARAMQGLESGAGGGDPTVARDRPAAAEGQRPQNAIAEERVTLAETSDRKPLLADLPMRDYKDAVAEDSQFVKETVSTKLSELGLDQSTRLALRSNVLGDLEIDSQMATQTRERIENDLNNNRAFRAAFSRLSVNQPTVDYLENVSRISRAYGEGNAMLESIVSDNPENNHLRDLAHRYHELRKQIASEDGFSSNGSNAYEIRFN